MTSNDWYYTEIKYKDKMKKGDLPFKEVVEFASKPGVGPEVNLGPLECTTAELGSSEGFSFEEMVLFSSVGKAFVKKPHREGLSFSELEENMNRFSIIPDPGIIGPGVKMDFVHVEPFSYNESLISAAEIEYFASSPWANPFAYSHEWEEPSKMVNPLMKPEFSSFFHFGGEGTQENFNLAMLKPFWIPTADDLVMDDKWQHLMEGKKWEAVKPTWKPALADISESTEHTEIKPDDLPFSFEELVKFAHSNVGPNLSMGPLLSGNIMGESDLESGNLRPTRISKVSELIKKFDPIPTRSIEKTTDREYIVTTRTFRSSQREIDHFPWTRAEQKMDMSSQMTQGNEVEMDRHSALKQFLASDDFEPILFFSYPRSSLFPSAIGQ